MSVRSYAASDIGRVRKRNEDCWFNSDELGLYVLADGMGGHPNGDIASKLAVSVAVESVRAKLEDRSNATLETVVYDCIVSAHAKLVEANGDEGESDSMGTTLSTVLIEGEKFAAASVGDSKCFWLSTESDYGRIVQISSDDTVAASLIRQGVPPRLLRGQENHTLTQAVGISGVVRPYVASGFLASGDLIIMCSDGITDFVPSNVFRETALVLARSPRALVEALIRAALAGGGGDNCTCICILADK